MKTVVVTGGVRGIGRSIARSYLKASQKNGENYRVIVTYSQDEKNAEKMREEGAEVYRFDVSDGAAVRAFFDKIGKVDILVNNAGVSLIKQIQDTTEAEFDRVFSVNVKGAFLCSREAAKKMISQGRGLIVNISSVWGEVGASCESVYSASKAALIGFTKALAKELGWSGVRVNSVSPGVIQTQMNACFSPDDLAAIKDEIPAGRLGEGEEVASAVRFLEGNDYVTGADIPVNGGFSIV